MRRTLLTVCVLLAGLLLSAGAAAAVDTRGPSVSLDAPVTGGSATLPFPNVPTGSVDLAGSVIDATGVSLVRAQVHRSADDFFWNGSSWQATPAWNTATTTADSWTLAGVDFADEGSYALRFAARDTLGNTSGVRDNLTYRLEAIDDTEAPTAEFLTEALHGIVRPPQPTVYESATPFQVGSYHVEVLADDNIGVASVKVQIVRSEPREYWNGSGWQSSPAWVSIPYGGDRLTFIPWRTQVPVDFSQLGTYTVRMHLTDFAGNVVGGAANPMLIIEIAPDTTPPVARMTTPRWWLAILPGGITRYPSTSPVPAGEQRIAGKAVDEGDGVASVRAQIERRTATPGYWNGDGWQSSPVWVETEIHLPANPNLIGWQVRRVDMSEVGEYVVRLASRDNAGNQSGASGNWKSFIRVE